MPVILAWLGTGAEAGLLALAVVAITLLAVVGYRSWKASRIPAEELERRRRNMLATGGKLVDAVLVEVRDDLLFFTYDVRGMEYTASQDISGIRDQATPDLSSISAVGVKYLPGNPANSIVLAEAWSGLRAGKIKTAR